MSVAPLLEGKRICICAGSGGVGKTTTSAAIAMGMAARGLKVAVVTIDPAKRLANALGLEELGNEPRRIEPSRFAGHGIEIEGELWAMMLDQKRTFDDLIDRLSADDKTRDEILENRIYQQLSGAVAGSQEFTAIAKLYELDRDGGFDLLVLDTPPSRNALDFLDAPDRLTQFFEGRALQVFLRPTGLAAKVVGRGTSVVFSVLKRVTGVDLLADLSVFFRSLGGLIDGFKERAVQVDLLLADPQTTFLLVTSPESEPVEEALYFAEKLAAAELPFGGAIVNRMHHDAVVDVDVAAVAAELEPDLGPRLASRVAENYRDYHVLVERDRRGIERFAAGLGVDADELITVPHLDDDVHDLDGLVEIWRYLFASTAERRELLATVTS